MTLDVNVGKRRGEFQLTVWSMRQVGHGRFSAAELRRLAEATEHAHDAVIASCFPAPIKSPSCEVYAKVPEVVPGCVRK